MPNVVALIPTDLNLSRLGLASRITQRVAGATVLEHTLRRVGAVGPVSKIILLHPPGQDPLAGIDREAIAKPVEAFVDPAGLWDRYRPMLIAARKWALSAWRGGLGNATCHDEILFATPMVAAIDRFGGESALLVGADWLLVDPLFCTMAIERHLEHPQAHQCTFTQAPPGLAGIVAGKDVLQQMAANNVNFGRMFAYNPVKPQADAIGKDVCVQIPAEVRGFAERIIYDTPASMKLIGWLADRLGSRFTGASALEIVQAAAQLDLETSDNCAALPQQITLELTLRRPSTGPITPQHYVSFDRPDMPLDTALQIIQQLGQDQDTVLTLGGLGDALLHSDWDKVVQAAHEAGVLGVAIETDLVVERPVLPRLLELPVDVLSVRLNADTAKMYQKVMEGNGQASAFAKVLENIEWLLNERNRRSAAPPEGANAARMYPARPGLPWIVPRFVKTVDTLPDMETFFDRWMHITGHAVIESPSEGCGLMPRLAPMRMAPPKRFACRQLHRRMTVLSDGRVALCDQDWLGRGSVGDATTTPLSEIWRVTRSLRQAHQDGQWDQLDLCKVCHEWHRP